MELAVDVAGRTRAAGPGRWTVESRDPERAEGDEQHHLDAVMHQLVWMRTGARDEAHEGWGPAGLTRPLIRSLPPRTGELVLLGSVKYGVGVVVAP